MFKVLLLLFPLTTFSSIVCDELFNSRGKGPETAQEAIKCYGSASSVEREIRSKSLNKISYLKFFIAEYHTHDKEELLIEAITLAERSLLLFGAKYSLEDYRKLNESERKLLAEALYIYGLSTSRYVEIKGPLEAIRRMEDIKKSMNTIIRIKEEGTAHYGAHRTLGIFHTRVPAVAGGQISIAREYFLKAIGSTLYRDGLSLYPYNHIAYADLLFKLGENSNACNELKKVIGLTEVQISAMDNGFHFESLVDIEKARENFRAQKCSN